MKRESVIHFTATYDEYKQLRKMVRSYEDDNEVFISISEFIHKFIFIPYLKNNSNNDNQNTNLESIPSSEQIPENPTEPIKEEKNNSNLFNFNMDNL